MKLGFFLIFCMLFCMSCDEKKFKFVKETFIKVNANKSTPLTCYVEFETEVPYRNVSFKIIDSEREYQLNYNSSEKKDQGFLIFLMRPGHEHKINIEITDSKGIKHS